jgi:hypothetical protein
VNPESKKVYPQPVLNAESFQRLLAAAYVLQVHGERPSQDVAISPKPSFGSAAIVQKRTPSRRSPSYLRPLSFRTLAKAGANVAPRVSRVTCWRRFETFAIGGVFCLMLATSIHRLAALPAGSSLSLKLAQDRNTENADISETLGQSPTVLQISERSLSARTSSEATAGSEEAVLQDSTPAEPATRSTRAHALVIRLAVNRNAGVPDKVVRYGDDVTVWKENPRATARNAQGR